MTLLSPIRSPYLRDQAFARLRDAIVSGVLQPGAPVVIDDLAGMFGLSGMPVREAVRRLVGVGLVEELPRRAHRVAPLTKRSALDVLTIAETLMVRAYELGAPAVGRAEATAMRRALQSAADCASAGDLVGALAGIHAMHTVVYDATGNAEFERALAAVVPRFDRVLCLWYTESVVGVGTSYRRDVVRALEQGRPSESVDLLAAAWRRFREVISAREDDEAL